MSWFVEALKKYAVFSGRSRRKEYWYYVLFVVLISIVLRLYPRTAKLSKM